MGSSRALPGDHASGSFHPPSIVHFRQLNSWVNSAPIHFLTFICHGMGTDGQPGTTKIRYEPFFVGHLRERRGLVKFVNTFEQRPNHTSRTLYLPERVATMQLETIVTMSANRIERADVGKHDQLILAQQRHAAGQVGDRSERRFLSFRNNRLRSISAQSTHIVESKPN